MNLAIFAFAAMFFIVVVMILLPFIQQRRKSKHSQSQVVNARVITKTMSLDEDDEATYFVTFQAENGECIELYVRKWQYDELSEGDCGKLIFQETEYIAFKF